MFIGAINSQLRSILAVFREFQDRPVYVGCSGNFTVERVLASKGVKELHSNDVSLYSCAVGSSLVGHPIEIGIADDELSWMGRYLEPGPPAIATLLLCSEMLKHYQLSRVNHICQFSVNQFCRFTSSAWPRCWAASVR